MAALDAIEAREPSLHHGTEPASAGEAAVECTGDLKEGKVEKTADEAPTTAVAAAAAAADDDDREPPHPAPPPPPKPKPCSSCGADSRYQCPRCGERSCSAPCVGKHKEATGCTGKRDRAAFVPVSSMTETTLASDIGLLEEVERAAAAAQRGAALPPALAAAVAKAASGGTARAPPRGSRGGQSNQRPSPSHPPHLQQLVAEASRRGVGLRLAPPGFDARRHNGTRYDGKQRRMQWHLEWRFFLGGDGASSGSPPGFATREDRRVREDAPLGTVLRRHLEGSGGAALLPPRPVESGASSAATAAAAAADPLPFRALLRLDGRPANSPGWLEFSLDEGVTLAELLRGRTVDEHPVVALVAATAAGGGGGGGSSAPPLPPGEVVAFACAAPPAVVPLPAAAAAPRPPPPAPLSPVAVAEENGEACQL